MNGKQPNGGADNGDVDRSTLSLNLYQTLEEVQAQHGVRHQDYAQYHQYCTSRLYRIRHHRDVRTLLTHNARYAPGSGGGSSSSGGRRMRHAFCPRDVLPPQPQPKKSPDDGRNGADFDKGAEDDGDEGRTGPPPVHIAHEYVLWNIFFQAERCWAQACELQQLQQEASSGGGGGGNKKKALGSGGSTKKSHHCHAQRRLNKAVKWAQKLRDAASESTSGGTGRKCDDTTVRECRSYLAWMKGNAALEHKDHLNAYRCYHESMTVLLRLANDGGVEGAATKEGETDGGDNGDNGIVSPHILALKDLWTTRAETVLRPMVRFCQYEARDVLDQEEVQRLEEEAARAGHDDRASKKNSLSASSIVVQFHGQDIGLDSYKPLTVLYLKMEDLLEQQKRHGSLEDDTFLQLLTHLDDAIRWTHAELGRYGGSGDSAGPAVTAKLQELSSLLSYWEYVKLSAWRHQQEERVLPALSDDGEILHVYDSLLQNAQAMANLGSGAAGDGGKGAAAAALGKRQSEEELEDDPIWLEAQAQVVRIRAFRCYYLARLYESTFNGTTAQVLALLRQASALTKRAVEEMSACIDEDDDDESDEDDVGANGGTKRGGGESYIAALEELANKIRAATCRAEATRFLQRQEAAGGGSTATDRPLWLRLDDLDSGTVLADDPPMPIPVPCKPAFYDLAWPYVAGDLPTRSIQEYIGENEPKIRSRNDVSSGGGGFLSWLTGSK